jgi:UDP-2,4-diacetamido-2,4,6-trideoxy-beta-L-altropyranose hydrolase
MVRVAFRVDASPRIGIGHAMRCLTLARMIAREAEADIRFVCNADVPDGVRRQMEAAGFGLLAADDADRFDWRTDARRFLELCGGDRFDWVVVDHYGIDRRWESDVRAAADRVLVIDDLADRPHDCDALLDQNLTADMETRYRGLVPDGCRLFVGPGCALIREAFFVAKGLARERTALNRVLVNFGGSDPTGETFKVLDALAQTGFDAGQAPRIHAHVVAGPANPRLAELADRCRALPNVTLYPEVKEMARFLADMDVAIGAGGVSLWERSFMGVPSAVIAVAGNQVPSAVEAARRGMIWYLGQSADVSAADIAGLLRNLAADPAELGRKSRQSLREMHTLRNVSSHPVVSFMLDERRTERS